MKRSHLFLIVGMLLAMIIAVLAAVSFLAYRGSQIAPPPEAKEQAPARAKYTKGKVAFFYPTHWQLVDMPAQSDLITVQVFDPKENIVFVAISKSTFNESVAGGELLSEKELTLDGVKGRERIWQNDKTGVAVFRADKFEFADRFYGFELVTNVSRKTKSERLWQEIMASVKFDHSEEEGIEAMPQQ